MLDRGMIETDCCRIGAEQEFFLVDSYLRPAPVAMPVLSALNDPEFTTEMGKFNIECNLQPRRFEGGCLRELEDDLGEKVACACAAANQNGADILLMRYLADAAAIGLSLDNLTPSPRYLELNNTMMRTAEPVPTPDPGRGRVHLMHDNVMPEAACTSFQIHFQAGPELLRRALQHGPDDHRASAGGGSESPLLLGYRLWQETRIALFQHSVDERSSSHWRATIRRVSASAIAGSITRCLRYSARTSPASA